MLNEIEQKYFTNDVEKQKRESLNKLMSEWKEAVASKRENATFCRDGFYPGYFASSPKVLFIGREDRWNETGDRVLDDLDKWFDDIKDRVNGELHWRRIFSILYGIHNHGKCSYEELPDAKTIFEKMRAENNYGFAIMNVSKYQNDGEDSATSNYGLINQFLEDSNASDRNFALEEIELLDPDIVITMNLWDGKISEEHLGKMFAGEYPNEKKAENGAVVMYDWEATFGKKIKMLDTYHFSARKSDADDFYNPIMEMLFK